MALKISWENELILYILKGHAEFVKGYEIANGLLQEFETQFEPIKKEIGDAKLLTRVHEKVKVLSPTSKKFPEQYRNEFNRLRSAWTENAKSIKGYHRTARLETLQNLLEETLSIPIDEKYTQGMRVQAVLKIVAEMRNEGDKAQIHVPANEPQVSPQDQINDYYRLMTPEQIKELEDADAAGKPVAPVFKRIVDAIRLGDHADGRGIPSGTETPDGVEPRKDAP